MTTRRQHTVWRYYLEAWQNHRGQVYCSRRGQILPHPTNPTNLMVERDFYRLKRITRDEAVFLSHFIQRTQTAELRRSHQDLVTKLAYIAKASELIQKSDTASPSEKEFARRAAIQTEDDLQTGAEQAAKPILEELRQGRAGFIKDYEPAMTFFYFVSHQYFRTKGVREAIGKELSDSFPGYDLSGLRNIVCHIGAVNVGASLFVDRKEFDIVFLERGGKSRFITGDQPVANLMGTGDGTETTELALYYPVSPALSCLVSPRSYNLRSRRVPDTAVAALNNFVAWESKGFLVSSSERELEAMVNRPPQTRPSGQLILDLLV